MDKKSKTSKKQHLSLAEKISILSEAEQAYVLGFIDGALSNKRERQDKKLTKQAKKSPAAIPLPRIGNKEVN